MATATIGGTASPIKHLISVQGVLTLLGFVTGVAAIVLPFGFIVHFPGKDYDVGVLPSLAKLVRGSELELEYLLWLVAHTPLLLLLLGVPIAAAYLLWLLTGGLAPWAWRTGYALAVLASVTLLAGFGLLVYAEFQDDGTLQLQSVVAALCGLIALALGAWLVRRNRRAGLPHTLNALIAVQAVYVADALILLVAFIPRNIEEDKGSFSIAGWRIGALFVFLTLVIYVVQMALGSLRKGGTDKRVGAPT